MKKSTQNLIVGGVVAAGLATVGYFVYDRYFKGVSASGSAAANKPIAGSTPTPTLSPSTKPPTYAATTSPEINALIDAASQIAQAFPQLKPNEGGPGSPV